MNDKSFVINDQLIMSQAKEYNNWLYELTKPFLCGTSLEIGCGIGNLTQKIISTPKIQRHVVVEIDSHCLSLQRQHLSQKNPDALSKIEFVIGDFVDVNFGRRSFDIVICFNVLEHIEFDRKALRKMYELLNPGGHLVLFVPAFGFLFGEIDRSLRHFRRYNKSKLLHILQEEKFREIKMRYFNLIGFFGWFVNFTILKRNRQSRHQVLIFNKYIFPIQSFFEKFIPWLPIGQSLFAVAKKCE